MTFDAGGNRVLTLKAYDKAGGLAFSIVSTSSLDGRTITNRYDDNGDQVVDRIQTVRARRERTRIHAGDQSQSRAEHRLAA